MKNAAANLARGGAAALVAVLLPPFLVRSMSTESYGIWVLVLQLSAYTSLFDFGIQTAVGRFVAQANARRDFTGRDRIVSTATALLAGSALLALLLLGGLAWQLPHLFRAMPPPLWGDARLALLLVGGSLAIGLPASVFMGVFVGRQRFEVPAAIIAVGKIFQALAVMLVVTQGGGLVLMAAVAAASNILSAVAQVLACRRLAADVRVAPPLVSKEAGREVLGYCFSLSVWSFAMLLITGLDTTLVGIFDFRAVAYYAVAASLITFIAGIQNALFSVLMPEAAEMGARGDARPLGEMLVTATRYGMFALLLTGLPLILAAKPILTLWVGPSYASRATPLLQILVAANIIRLSAVPYATLLIGTGQQRLVTITPLVEGCSNLVVSVAAGAWLGALGVAIGTLVGSAIAIICNFAFNMPRTTGIALQASVYLKDGLLRPVVCGLPFALLAFPAFAFSGLNVTLSFSLASAGVISALILFWHWGLMATERRTLLSLLGPRFLFSNK